MGSGCCWLTSLPLERLPDSLYSLVKLSVTVPALSVACRSEEKLPAESWQELNVTAGWEEKWSLPSCVMNRPGSLLLGPGLEFIWHLPGITFRKEALGCSTVSQTAVSENYGDVQRQSELLPFFPEARTVNDKVSGS